MINIKNWIINIDNYDNGSNFTRHTKMIKIYCLRFGMANNDQVPNITSKHSCSSTKINDLSSFQDSLSKMLELRAPTENDFDLSIPRSVFMKI